MINGKTRLRQFDEFRLDIDSRVLWFGDEVVALAPKAVELLIGLTDEPGEVISKNDLIDRVWGDSFVEESNLSNNIYLLRKTLRALAKRDYIETVPRRGYRFNVPAEEIYERHEMTIERRFYTHTFIEQIADSSPVYPPAPLLVNDATSPTILSVKVLHVVLAIFVLATFAVLTGAAFWTGTIQYRSPGIRSIRNIAVLPLRSQGDSDHGIRQQLSEGLASQLSRRDGIVVRNSSAMLRYDHDLRDPVEIGRELAVDAIIDGRIQNEGGRLRVNLQILDVRSGEHIWSGQFDGRPNELLAVEDSIVSRIVGDLGLAGTNSADSLAKRRPTENTEAYQAYHRGRVLYFNRLAHPDNFDNAIKEFEHALALDPTFALAKTGLADIYARRANDPKSLNAKDDDYRLAMSYAERALAIDPNLAESHTSYAWLQRMYAWDFHRSNAHFQRALSIDPNNPDTHRLYSYLLTTIGNVAGAVDHARRSVELDPASHANIRSYAFILTLAGQYEDALEQHERAWRIDPGNTNDFRYLLMALYFLGRDQAIIDRYETLPPNAKKSFQTRTYLALAYRRLGQIQNSERLLRELSLEATKSDDRRVRFASTLAGIGRNAEALDHLEEGLRVRDDRMLWIKVQPELQSLRFEPRFQAILREMNLAD